MLSKINFPFLFLFFIFHLSVFLFPVSFHISSQLISFLSINNYWYFLSFFSLNVSQFISFFFCPLVSPSKLLSFLFFFLSFLFITFPSYITIISFSFLPSLFFPFFNSLWCYFHPHLLLFHSLHLLFMLPCLYYLFPLHLKH